MSDSITILRCARGLHLAKLIRPGEIVPYDNARTFDVWTHSLSNLEALQTLLNEVIDLPRLCVVRGELIDVAQASGIRRLLYADPENGEVPTLRDIPRQ